jgi:hypothetical protein
LGVELTKELPNEDPSSKIICPPDHCAAPFVIAIVCGDERPAGCGQRSTAIVAAEVILKRPLSVVRGPLLSS